jgi:anionic cell wall polymer biosynthesis LytR-Cps2A-Psr (LCP) family protein
MAFGGANLVAKTVYELTKIPLNGAAIVNFQGIRNMVAAVGGVRVCIPYTAVSLSGQTWQKGCHDLNAEDAEAFSRARHFAGGDLGRIKNQQHVIKGIIAKVKQNNMMTDPAKLNALVTTAAKSLTVDKSMNLMELALQVKDIDQDAIKFATTPIVGTMTTDAGSSVKLDDQAAQELFKAVIDDKTNEWLAAHPQPEVATL